MVKVLFVCLGNICRSPTADGVFRKKVANANLSEKILVDSVGTGSWYIGEMPDARATQTAMENGYDLSDLRGRQIHQSDFEHFDYILAMDSNNLDDLCVLSPEQYRSKLQLLLEYAFEISEKNVPDPYYGGVSGFDDVLHMIEQATDGLLDHIQQHHVF